MDSEASGSTAFNSSFTSLSGGEYEVFLSFRGPDTRHTFTDFLYTNLKGAGVRTFRDDNELRKGEEIGPELYTAITQSRISIPIFSKNYASSKWCLRELAQMVECKKTTRQLILPIFYDVDPSEVKDYQSGSYKKAFCEHERWFPESTVKEWKEALREVGLINGWEVKKVADGHQGELVKIVVQKVLLELKKNYMVLTDNLVEIDDHEMMRLLKVDSNDTSVRIVGIYGMGGIGKTTIAKCIYNKLIQCFECCSFLADIRETEQHKGLVSLQKQFLVDTLRWCPDIANISRGIEAIENRFGKKKVLIVLDDLNKKSQFDCLAGNRKWFGTGSRIIVTTRDKHVLNAIQVDEAYEPPSMDYRQSLQLFSMHAFRRKFPPEDYINISRMVASTAAGLPLALEIIGSFLSDKTKAVWEDTLKKLKKIPNEQVQKKLRISYDELNHRQQQIFLDIACVFIGMNKSYAFYMWDDCGYYPEEAINVLCLMSLVKIGDDNVLMMHDQLRDLGRDIVCQEDIENPEVRSRLWDQKEALEVLKSCKGTEKVKVLSLHLKSCFTSKEFTTLTKLRYLQVDGAELVGDFEDNLSKLKWLRWKNCPLQFTATNFHVPNLIILDLSDSKVTEKWRGWSQIKAPETLKILDLANCDLSITPSFSTYATSLEILNLKGCESLVKIDPSIGKMKKLKVLNISLTRIRKLPDEIWILENLEVIDASRCYDLEGNIPGCVEGLSSLRRLSIDRTNIQSIETSICKLSRLQTLDLELCGELKAVSDLPSSLEILKAGYFRSRNLCDTPNLANLVNLQELQFSGSSKQHLEIPREIEKFSKLQRMILSYTNIRTIPKEVGALSQLEILTIHSCGILQCILGLPSSLVELYIQRCASLEILADLSNLKKLSKLILLHCIKLTEIQGLGGQESLTILYINTCHALKEVRFLGNLKSLVVLHINACDMLKEIEGLGNLKSLKGLYIGDCNKIATLDLLEHSASMPDPSNLKKLEVYNCKNLNKIQGLDRLELLEDLSLRGCSSIERLSNLLNLKMLIIVDLAECTGLREIEGGREAVESNSVIIELSGCTSLEDHDIPQIPPEFSMKVIHDEWLYEVTGCKFLSFVPEVPHLLKTEIQPSIRRRQNSEIQPSIRRQQNSEIQPSIRRRQNSGIGSRLYEVFNKWFEKYW